MIEAMLQRLTKFGSLIELSWDEDDNAWSVVWITGNVRSLATHLRLVDALQAVWVDAAAYRAQDLLAKQGRRSGR